MERLSPLDASFLRAETASAHMHVGWLALLDEPEGGGPLDADTLARRLEARLGHAPRFRKRVVEVPVGEPPLVDDPGFSVGRHLRSVPVPEGGLSEAGLQEALDAFLSQQLDRAKPLWEIAVVPELQGGGAAILGKVHHALVDGVAAVELGTLLFDLSADAARVADEAPALEASQPPSPVRLLIDSATDAALEQFRTAGRIANLGLRPTEGLRMADSMRRAAFQVAKEIAEPAPDSYLNGPIGPERTLRTTTLPLPRVIGIKETTAAKLNDVVLAVVSGALREFSARTDTEPGPLRAMIPINVRAGEGEGTGAGNRIAFGFVELPVAAPDPLARLRSVRRQSSALRGNGRAAGRDALMQSVGMLPGPIKNIVTRAASSSRTFNLTVSNVPGPRFPLYAAGCRVRSIFPVIPLAGSHALAIGVLTYDDGLHVALHADPGRLPEAAELPGLFADALGELEAAVRESGGEPRRVRRRGPAPPARQPSRRQPAAG